MAANIQALVDEGYICLDTLMKDSWQCEASAIAQYNGDRNEVECHLVYIERAQLYGVIAYRWVDILEGDLYDRGSPMLSRTECVREARKHARSQHKEIGT